MGQRLVIQIEQNGEPLANAYYHWSAYTRSAAEMTEQVREYLDEAGKTWSNFKKAIWALYKTGARFDPVETTRVETAIINGDYWDRDNFGFVFDDMKADRNAGLLCITEEGMRENVGWEEGHVDIDIETNEIYFDVMSVETVEDYLMWNDEPDSLKPDDMPILDTSEYLEFKEEEWEEFYPKLINLCESGEYCAISSDKTTIYEFFA